MSVSLVVIRLELAGHSPVPTDFGFSAAAGEMSDEEKAAIIHQHLGRREMTDVIIETMKARADEVRDTVEEKKPSAAPVSAQRSREQSESVNTAPESPSKQLPDQISFFSGNPSVEIVHGIMHLYKSAGENKIVRIEKDTAEEINNMKTKFKETIEKCDSLELRLSDLLKEKQSVERKCTQLNTRVAKLSTELQEEQELNKCLRANQLVLQNQLKEEEKLLKETCAQKDLQITEIQEQLRDVMFYLETQQQISHLPAETRQEIQEGQINIAMASAPNPPSSGAGGKLQSRKGRSKRGK